MIPNNWKQPKCPSVGEHINTKLIQKSTRKHYAAAEAIEPGSTSKM